MRSFRHARRALHVLLPLGGAVLVILAVVLPLPVWVSLILGLGGLVLAHAGSRQLVDAVLPDERRFLGLRREAERFLALIRQLNTAAMELEERNSDGARLAVDEIQRQMQASVDTMIRVAGRSSRVVLEQSGEGAATPVDDGRASGSVDVPEPPASPSGGGASEPGRRSGS